MIKKVRLGVNIDHVATVRNARGDIYPDPLRATAAQQGRFNNYTFKRDRRHIRDQDLKIIKKLKYH